MSDNRRHLRVLLALAAAVVIVFALRLAIGRVPQADGTWALQLSIPQGTALSLRIGAAVSAIAAGWALGLSGLLLQVLLRNPLASPWILGLSSGAGLGVMSAMALAAVAGWTLPGGGGLVLPAAIGALGALGVTWSLGRTDGVLDPLKLLLVGVVIASLAAALSMALQEVVPHGVRADFLEWMMGRIPEAPSHMVLGIALGGSALAAIWSFCAARRIDISMLGEDEARSSGLDLGGLRMGLFLFSGVLAAAAVALVGPIGFVGLLAPHIARLGCGPQHRQLVPATCMVGALLLLGAETARQCVDLGGGRLHVGVLTAVVGGPFFLWMLKTRFTQLHEERHASV